MTMSISHATKEGKKPRTVSGMNEQISNLGLSMKSKRSWSMAGIFAVLMLAGSTGALAQAPLPGNLTLEMIGPAADKHFGSQAIHGVVRLPRKDDDHDHGR
jgi:hypothetical protein